MQGFHVAISITEEKLHLIITSGSFFCFLLYSTSSSWNFWMLISFLGNPTLIYSCYLYLGLDDFSKVSLFAVHFMLEFRQQKSSLKVPNIASIIDSSCSWIHDSGTVKPFCTLLHALSFGMWGLLHWSYTLNPVLPIGTLSCLFGLNFCPLS